MTDAPVHFAANGDMGPQQKYNRFVAVFEVDKADSGTTARDGGTCSEDVDSARLVGTAMAMMDSHIHGLGHHLGHTWERRAERK